MRVVVLGLGNILLSDEGMGVHAVNQLNRDYDLPPDVEILDGGTSGMDCLDQIADLDFLLIADCMRSKQPIGTITRLDDGQIRAYFKTKISPHQVGLCDVLATLQLHGIAPTRTVLIGIEPGSFALSMEPTPELAACLPAMVAALVVELAAAGLVATPKAT